MKLYIIAICTQDAEIELICKTDINEAIELYNIIIEGAETATPPLFAVTLTELVATPR